MKVKIEIKHWITESVLFEYEKENNTVKDTLIEAVSKRADLRCANLRRADLQGADLQGAYLQGAYLRGADGGKKEVKSFAVFTGLYTYLVLPYITIDGEKRIKMGCCNRSLEEWESNFWNNDSEFPNNGSLKSNLRLMAYNTAKNWLELIEP